VGTLQKKRRRVEGERVEGEVEGERRTGVEKGG
jgi:hypothetical protein